MRYKTAEFRRAWNRLAHRQYRLSCTDAALHEIMRARVASHAARYLEMQSWEAKDGTAHPIEF